MKTFDALSQVVAFFEERRGRLYGFRWRDRLDHSSAAPDAAVSATDQTIGTGDGATRDLPARQDLWLALFALSAADRQAGHRQRARRGGGNEVDEGTAFTVDTTTGVVTFLAGHIPASGAAVTAGFLFDVPVRFDTDYLEVDLSAFAAGAIPKIPLVEIRP